MQKKSDLIKNQRVNNRKLAAARELRKNTTEAETVFWERVRNRRFRSLKFRRQQIIDGFIVDFYCDKIRLCVEIDGNVHESQRVADYDIEREKVLKLRGLRVLRISNEDVLNDIDGVLERI